MNKPSTDTQYQTQPENLLDVLAPSYPPSQSTELWDIFINHCGKDVKHGLPTVIYDKLHSMGFHVFLVKDALHPGDSFVPELQHAMGTATHHSAVFSSSYVNSPWCLADLSFMHKIGAKIIPIFYYVDPSVLRWVDEGKEIYVTAVSEHENKRTGENKPRCSRENLREWKSALQHCSFLHGYTINNSKDEADVSKSVVNYSLNIMNKAPFPVAEHPVGLDELVQGFYSVATKEPVRITGIVGMGGSGKITLAEELYNRNFSSFQKCSFIFGLRDSRNALCKRQEKLLSDLGFAHLSFEQVDEGKGVLANYLNSQRVLIVLDDVDHIDQLNALLPTNQILGSESMVILTTRDLVVLIAWGLGYIYHIPALPNRHDKQLFCWHAFLQGFLPLEFEIFVKAFLKACNGLPLSLKVMGVQLYGRKSKDYWKSSLNKIKKTLREEIQKRLEVSYKALDDEEKKVFLDVACFLIGEKKSRVVAVWGGSGWSGLNGLETFVNKCLLELEEGRFEEDARSPEGYGKRDCK